MTERSTHIGDRHLPSLPHYMCILKSASNHEILHPFVAFLMLCFSLASRTFSPERLASKAFRRRSTHISDRHLPSPYMHISHTKQAYISNLGTWGLLQLSCFLFVFFLHSRREEYSHQ